MRAIYSLCDGGGRCLTSPLEILQALPTREKFTEEKLEKILEDLELDGYFECLLSDRKGEKMYVIVLRAAGFAFQRENANQKREAAYRLFWSIVSAVVAFFVGLFLRSVF